MTTNAFSTPLRKWGFSSSQNISDERPLLYVDPDDRGSAEQIRLLLADSEIQWEQRFITPETYSKMEVQGKVPIGTLPLIQWGDLAICKPSAIMEFIAAKADKRIIGKVNNYLGADEGERASARSLCHAAESFYDKFVLAGDPSGDHMGYHYIHDWLQQLDHMADSTQIDSMTVRDEGGFRHGLTGNGLNFTFGDISVFDVLNQFVEISTEGDQILRSYIHLVKWYNRCKVRPFWIDYFQHRDEKIDLVDNLSSLDSGEELVSWRQDRASKKSACVALHTKKRIEREAYLSAQIEYQMNQKKKEAEEKAAKERIQLKKSTKEKDCNQTRERQSRSRGIAEADEIKGDGDKRSTLEASKDAIEVEQSAVQSSSTNQQEEDLTRIKTISEEEENIQQIIKAYIKENRISLWEPPYFVNQNPRIDEIEALANIVCSANDNIDDDKLIIALLLSIQAGAIVKMQGKENGHDEELVVQMASAAATRALDKQKYINKGYIPVMNDVEAKEVVKKYLKKKKLKLWLPPYADESFMANEDKIIEVATTIAKEEGNLAAVDPILHSLATFQYGALGKFCSKTGKNLPPMVVFPFVPPPINYMSNKAPEPNNEVKAESAAKSDEEVKAICKDYLKNQKVRLWMEPYCDEDFNANLSSLKDISVQIAESSSKPEWANLFLHHIIKLQYAAMSKSAQKKGKKISAMIVIPDSEVNGNAEQPTGDNSPIGMDANPSQAESTTVETDTEPIDPAELKKLVKGFCKTKRIRLWEPPYYDNGYQNAAIVDMAQNISDANNINNVSAIVSEIKTMIDFTVEKMADKNSSRKTNKTSEDSKTTINTEDIKIAVKTHLKENKLKIWLSPYVENEKFVDSAFEELADAICTSRNVSGKDAVVSELLNLAKNAQKKILAKNTAS